MAYAVDRNYQNVNKDVEQYLSEQQKLQRDIGNSKLFSGNGMKVGAAAAEFRLLAEEQDRIDAFNQMADDYFDGKKIDQILENRRRDPLNEAIDERDNRVQSAMQQGNFVDTRDKEFLFHSNPQQYEQARVQGEVANQGVLNDAKITELNQAELDVISQLTGKDEYGQERHQTVEELRALKEKMEIIQEMKANTDVSSQIQAPHIMSTEELMVNQMNLQQLQQQLNSEYHELNSSLQGRSR
jgi:hypothetical protein